MSILGLAAGVIAGGPTVSLAPLTDVIDLQIGIASSASFSLLDDGTIQTDTTTTGPVIVGDWIKPTAAAGAAYEALVTVNSGALTSGTTGTWVTLDLSRTWVASVAPAGFTVAANITVQIRRSGGAALASKTITVSATSEP